MRTAKRTKYKILPLVHECLLRLQAKTFDQLCACACTFHSVSALPKETVEYSLDYTVCMFFSQTCDKIWKLPHELFPMVYHMMHSKIIIILAIS